jgi:Fe-S oxidoreductase
MAADRVKSALEIDSEMIVTACPFCETNLNSGAKQIGSQIRVVDIVDLIAERLK